MSFIFKSPLWGKVVSSFLILFRLFLPSDPGPTPGLVNKSPSPPSGAKFSFFFSYPFSSLLTKRPRTNAGASEQECSGWLVSSASSHAYLYGVDVQRIEFPDVAFRPDMDTVPALVRERDNNVARNRAVLAQLGLGTLEGARPDSTWGFHIPRDLTEAEKEAFECQGRPRFCWGSCSSDLPVAGTLILLHGHWYSVGRFPPHSAAGKVAAAVPVPGKRGLAPCSVTSARIDGIIDALVRPIAAAAPTTDWSDDEELATPRVPLPPPGDRNPLSPMKPVTRAASRTSASLYAELQEITKR